MTDDIDLVEYKLRLAPLSVLFGDGYIGYDDLVSSFNYEIIVDAHDNDYQGDSYYLLKAGHKYGYLCFGWGSCSGCDALEGASTMKEKEELRESLYHSIVYFDSIKEVHDYLVSEDNMNFYRFSGNNGFTDFVAELKKLIPVTDVEASVPPE